MNREIIHTDNAPKAIGPYSQAILAEGKFLFVSGQVGFDPSTGAMAGDDVQTQARQVLNNLRAIVEAGGGSLADVVKTTVYLASIDDYKAVNAIYAEFFGENPPARAAFGGLQLPAGALVEIECIVSIPK